MTARSSLPSLSIVVATWRRPDHLARLLEALSGQTVAHDLFEVIVVDNDSESLYPIRALCESQGNHSISIRYLHHPESGISYARNRGIDEARTDWIVFLDDDVIPPLDYVQQVLTLISTGRFVVFGGPFSPFYTASKPVWFKDKYATLHFGNAATWLEGYKYPAGANMVWKRELLNRLGKFSPRYGYHGRKQNWGEDTEMCHRAAFAGVGIWYDPALAVRHHFGSERMSVRWLIHKIVMVKRTMAHLILKDINRNDPRPVYRKTASVFKDLCLHLFRLARSCLFCLFRNKRTYPYLENYFVEVIGEEMGQVSLMTELALCFVFPRYRREPLTG